MFFPQLEVTVEPAVFFSFIAQKLIAFINMSLYLNKVCRPNATVEPELSTPCEDEISGLKFITSTYSVAASTVTICNLILVLFATIYSDLAGKKRKMFLYLPILGQLVEIICLGLQAWFWTFPADLGLYIVTVINALHGGLVCLQTFSSIITFDQTSTEERLFRIYILTCVKNIGQMIGKGSSGFLLTNFGFFYSYLLCGLLTIGSALFTYLFVDDMQQEQEKETKSDVDSEQPNSHKSALKRTFNVRSIFMSYKSIIWSSRLSMKHRFSVIIGMVIVGILMAVLASEENILYIYLRYRFSWDERKYGLYSFYRVFTVTIGGMLYTILVNKIFIIHDTIIIGIACVMDALAALGLFFAVNDWQLYTIPIIDSLHGVSTTVAGSYITKFYRSEEFGQMSSLNLMIGVGVGFAPVLYSHVFEVFMKSIPNLMYLISVGCYIICVLGSVLSYFLSSDVK